MKFSTISDVNPINVRTKKRNKNQHLSWNLRIIIIHLVKLIWLSKITSIIWRLKILLQKLKPEITTIQKRMMKFWSMRTYNKKICTTMTMIAISTSFQIKSKKMSRLKKACDTLKKNFLMNTKNQ